MVEGPAWTGVGLDERAGKYPLRVERAVARLVDKLLPGVITTTRHARMYTLHALAWAEADERGLGKDEAEEFVRRCEVAIAGVYHHHASHRTELSSAHGEGRLHRFVADGVLDIERAARPGGLSTAGFANVYVGASIRIGLLSPDQPPRRGARADLTALRMGLGDLLPLAERDRVPIRELADAGHLCLCSGIDAADGRLLRRVLFEEPEEGRVDDRHRQLTAHMTLDAVAANPRRSCGRQPGCGCSGPAPHGCAAPLSSRRAERH